MNNFMPLFILCLLQFLAISVLAQSKGKMESISQKDTIEFSLSWNFAGDCGQDCYKFLGTGSILKINGKPVGQNCDHIFVKCPSGIKLYKSQVYKFVAIAFTPNDCSTRIDMCTGSQTYLLLNKLN
jgi:hypothetical protein